MTLNPRIFTNAGSLYLEWDVDPDADGYRMTAPDGSIHQVGRNQTIVKLGQPAQPFTVAVASDYPATAETLTYPATPPTLTVTQSIVEGSQITAPVDWTATPSATVTEVDFYIDAALKQIDVTPPYTYRLDPADLADGTHTFTVRALDAKGKTATSDVTATTKKPTPPPGVTITDLKGLCLYDRSASQGDPARARDLVGSKLGRSDWPAAGWVTNLKTAGIQVLPIACYDVIHGNAKAMPTDVTAWCNKLKADYAGAWQSPPAVEIWNEPWSQNFWGPDPDPVAYLTLAKAAAAALWSVNPNCTALIPCDVFRSGSRQVNADGTYKQWLVPLIAADTTGLLKDPRVRPTVHCYCGNLAPSQTNTGQLGLEVFQRYSWVYDKLKANGHPDPQCWITEFGWFISASLSEQTQANYTTQAIKIMQASGKVERATCFYLYSPTTDGYDWLSNGQPRPVCAAVKALT